VAFLVARPQQSALPDAGVIEEARARQRRQTRAATVAGVAVAGIVAILLASGGGQGRGHAGGGGPLSRQPLTTARLVEPPAKVLARQPDMGLACATPQVQVCNLIGLAVWLRTGAVSATATIHGEQFKLDSREWSGPADNGKRTFLAGFLTPGPFVNSGWFKTLIAGMGREGWQAPITTVHLTIDYGGEHAVQTATRVVGLGGWG
jgi:hypothetical protein